MRHLRSHRAAARPGRKTIQPPAQPEGCAHRHPLESQRMRAPSPAHARIAVLRTRRVHELAWQGIHRNRSCTERRRHGLHTRTREHKVKVQSITLREIRMPLVTPFETSFGRLTDRRMLLVEVQSDGVVGWGESVAGEGPFYAPETVETAWHIRATLSWPLPAGRVIRKGETVGRALETIHCRLNAHAMGSWSPRCGTPRPSKRAFHYGNCWEERTRKSPAACPSVLKKSG